MASTDFWQGGIYLHNPLGIPPGSMPDYYDLSTVAPDAYISKEVDDALSKLRGIQARLKAEETAFFALFGVSNASDFSNLYLRGMHRDGKGLVVGEGMDKDQHIRGRIEAAINNPEVRAALTTPSPEERQNIVEEIRNILREIRNEGTRVFLSTKTKKDIVKGIEGIAMKNISDVLVRMLGQVSSVGGKDSILRIAVAAVSFQGQKMGLEDIEALMTKSELEVYQELIQKGNVGAELERFIENNFKWREIRVDNASIIVRQKLNSALTLDDFSANNETAVRKRASQQDQKDKTIEETLRKFRAYYLSESPKIKAETALKFKYKSMGSNAELSAKILFGGLYTYVGKNPNIASVRLSADAQITRQGAYGSDKRYTHSDFADLIIEAKDGKVYRIQVKNSESYLGDMTEQFGMPGGWQGTLGLASPPTTMESFVNMIVQNNIVTESLIRFTMYQLVNAIYQGDNVLERANMFIAAAAGQYVRAQIAENVYDYVEPLVGKTKQNIVKNNVITIYRGAMAFPTSLFIDNAIEVLESYKTGFTKTMDALVMAERKPGDSIGYYDLVKQKTIALRKAGDRNNSYTLTNYSPAVVAVGKEHGNKIYSSMKPPNIRASIDFLSRAIFGK